MAAITDPIPDSNLPSFMWVFEIESLVISFFSWLASFPGGYPHLLSFQADNESDVWDYVNWGYGTLLYGLDILSVAADPLVKKRFKRKDDVTAAATTVLATIQLVLSISASARTGGSITGGFANAISTLPGIAAFNRIEEVAAASDGISLGVLAGVDNLSATAALILSNVPG